MPFGQLYVCGFAIYAASFVMAFFYRVSKPRLSLYGMRIYLTEWYIFSFRLGNIFSRFNKDILSGGVLGPFPGVPGQALYLRVRALRRRAEAKGLLLPLLACAARFRLGQRQQGNRLLFFSD